MEARGGEDGVAGGGARRLAYAHGASAVPLLGETIGDRWSRTVAEYADREALVCCAQGIRWSYAELDEQVERCARAFLARGGGQG